MHFWGMLERRLAEIIFENRTSLKSANDKQKKILREESVRGVQKIRDLESKLELVGKIKVFGTIKSMVWKQPVYKLRNAISHDGICYQIHQGVYSPKPGWLKPDFVQKEIQNMPSSISFDNKRSKPVDTYSLEELVDLRNQLIKCLNYLKAKVEDENVYRWLAKKNLL